jgi:hypothetical protein
MPGQTNATYDAADTDTWFSNIDGPFGDMRDAWLALKAWKPNAPEVIAMGVALNGGCSAVRSLDTEARSRLGLPPRPNSGGTPKFA